MDGSHGVEHENAASTAFAEADLFSSRARLRGWIPAYPLASNLKLKALTATLLIGT